LPVAGNEEAPQTSRGDVTLVVAAVIQNLGVMRVGGGSKIHEVEIAGSEQPVARSSWPANGQDPDDEERNRHGDLGPAVGLLTSILIGLCLWLLIGIVGCALLAMSSR